MLVTACRYIYLLDVREEREKEGLVGQWYTINGAVECSWDANVRHLDDFKTGAIVKWREGFGEDGVKRGCERADRAADGVPGLEERRRRMCSDVAVDASDED